MGKGAGKGSGKGGADTEIWVGCGVCCVILICSAFLIGFSFRKLEANEVGLDYSANSLTIDLTQVYEPGVHFLGVGHSFIAYSRAVQEFTLCGTDVIWARTKDGLLVEICARLIYRVSTSVDALANLYVLFGDDFQEGFKRIARAGVRDRASLYTAFQFFVERENITESVANSLTDRLRDFHCNLDTFLMTNVELPDQFQAATTETDVRKQERATVEFEQERVVTETRTRVLEAGQATAAIAAEANATATAFQLGIDADVIKLQTAVEAELRSYDTLVDKLGFTQEELVAFVWLDTLSKATNARKVFSVESPSEVTVF